MALIHLDKRVRELEVVMIKAGIIGATGYTGLELVRLLLGHDQVRLGPLSSRTYAGQAFSQVYPSMTGLVETVLLDHDPDRVLAASDVVFVALPHGHAVEVARKALEKKVPLIDLGADFRFRDLEVYEDWYHMEHTGRDVLDASRYCLPELNRKEIPQTRVVANPGCYPTSALVGLAPLMRRGLIKTKGLVIDSKSGVSGAGRKASDNTHFVTNNDSFRAYGLGTHRHTPEIEEHLSSLAGEKVSLTFTPHLVPMTRGILSTMVAELKEDISEEALRKAYLEDYADEPFVQLLAPGVYPRTKWVYGSNMVHINLKKDERTGRVLVVSAIDNLVKGAAGQAVQNMNLLFSFPETSGLTMAPLFP